MFKHLLMPAGPLDVSAIAVHENIALSRCLDAWAMQVLVPVQTLVLYLC